MKKLLLILLLCAAVECRASLTLPPPHVPPVAVDTHDLYGTAPARSWWRRWLHLPLFRQSDH